MDAWKKNEEAPGKKGLYTNKSIFLRFYKNILSDQFNANCEFTNSCSIFTFAVIKEYGVIKGITLGLDRLLRCGSSGHWHQDFPGFVSRDGLHLTEDIQSFK